MFQAIRKLFRPFWFVDCDPMSGYTQPWAFGCAALAY